MNKRIVSILIFILFPLLIINGFSSWVIVGEKSETVGNTAITSSVCYINTDTAGKQYTRIEKALEKAVSGDIVYVKPGMNPSIYKDCEVKSNVKLIIPYEGTTYSNRAGNSTKFADSDDTYPNLKSNVIVKDNVVIKNNGTIIIGGVLGSESQGLSGQTSGYYSQITLGEKASIICSSGTIECYGYIKESSKNNESYVELKSSTIKMPYVIYDYRGGSSTGGVYKGDNGPISPFNVYDMPNIQSEISMDSSSTINGFVDLYTGQTSISKSFVTATINARHNTAEVVIFGTGGLIIPSSGANIKIKYTPGYKNNKPITLDDDSNGITNIKIFGGASFGSMSMELKAAEDVTYSPSYMKYLLEGIVKNLLNTTINTSDVYYPVCWKQQIELFNGTYTIPNKIKFLTGSSLTVHPDAILTSNSNTIFYSEFNDVTYGGSVYPSKNGAILNNNGTININSGFGADVISSTTGGKLVINSNAVLELTSYEGYGSRSGMDLTFNITSTITKKLEGNITTDYSSYSKTTFEKGTYTSNIITGTNDTYAWKKQ